MKVKRDLKINTIIATKIIFKFPYNSSTFKFNKDVIFPQMKFIITEKKNMYEETKSYRVSTLTNLLFLLKISQPYYHSNRFTVNFWVKSILNVICRYSVKLNLIINVNLALSNAFTRVLFVFQQ